MPFLSAQTFLGSFHQQICNSSLSQKSHYANLVCVKSYEKRDEAILTNDLLLKYITVWVLLSKVKIIECDAYTFEVQKYMHGPALQSYYFEALVQRDTLRRELTSSTTFISSSSISQSKFYAKAQPRSRQHPGWWLYEWNRAAMDETHGKHYAGAVRSSMLLSAWLHSIIFMSCKCTKGL